MDGFEATQAIRSIEKKRQTTSPAVVVALTGLGSDRHISDAYTAGVNVFLTKPIPFKVITRLMDDYMKGDVIQQNPQEMLSVTQLNTATTISTKTTSIANITHGSFRDTDQSATSKSHSK